MAGGTKTDDIIVTPYDLHGVVKWELEIVSSGKKGGPGNYPSLDIPAKQQATQIQISIKNTPGYNWKFAKDAKALWVKVGQDPTSPSTYPDQVPVGSIKTKNNDMTLQFVDLNKGDPVALHYTLNFVGPGNNVSSTLDPIIRNGGGGGPGVFNYAYIAGAVLLLAVGAYFTWRAFMR